MQSSLEADACQDRPSLVGDCRSGETSHDLSSGFFPPLDVAFAEGKKKGETHCPHVFTH